MCAICRLKDQIWQRMFTPEERKAYDDRRERFLVTDPVIVRGPANTWFLYRGGIATHEEAQDFIRGLQDFYSRLNPEELDILEMRCRDLELITTRQPEEKRKRNPRSGYIYVIRSDSGAYKIGMTTHPESRIKTFKSTLPFQVGYELLFRTDDMVGAERELQRRFAEQRLDGEWFNLTDEDIDWIRKEYVDGNDPS